MNPEISVHGARDISRALRAVGGKELAKQLRTTHKTLSERVVQEALPNVPTRSGALRGSVRALATQREARMKAGRKNVPYAAAVHWGRKRGNVGRPPGHHKGANPVQANPFLWNARERLQRSGQLTQQYASDIDQLLDIVRRAGA